MTATAHALIGASLAIRITNPYIGLPLAIISHFIADLIPHWDAGTNHRKKSLLRLKVEATLDVLLGFALVFLIFREQIISNPIYMFSMVIAAQLPDWVEAPSSMLLQSLGLIPFVGRAALWAFQPVTYYRVDTALMFQESVHLEDWPEVDENLLDNEVLEKMSLVN
ncbi:MAG: hypothetical protein UU23_C0001G0002 [Candidatus Curtissbacteria bacterium GW2011_GWA1_40_9]|uniref:Uncharacterized protein n=1 Tax=Candidatus Curtissbacteria bacterium GW2011_GWA1_40_9 TaxID=1618408 RepID=A0A0G0TMN7_9BACT|nr:MAG: hypothetical protein UU23_C0001G0002 [Candidatus Curtissbacteria bacterium GW2011_GWA1_40_9]